MMEAVVVHVGLLSSDIKRANCVGGGGEANGGHHGEELMRPCLKCLH